MLDKNISVDGNDNVVVSNIKDSTVNITLNNDKLKALKGLYDVIIEETNVVDTYVLTVLNRGGISWYGVGENRQELYEGVESVNRFVNQNRFFFSDDIYVLVSRYYSLATDLRLSLDNLVMAIATADDQDAITDVYDITYGQDIKCSSKFIRYMMNAFNVADKHPAYDDFAEAYELHEKLREKILAEIDKKRETVI